jgi:alpha-galactosidase
MGFNDWNATHCGAAFDEAMVERTADVLVSSGLGNAGYDFVNLDDCWALPARDGAGRLVPDPTRFPDGIAAVAGYVHAKGLKLGIYTSAGTRTCDPGGFPGSLGHEASDARQFASWGVDYVKDDNCNNEGVGAIQRYAAMGAALKATGRPIVYSICNWGEQDPWLWGPALGHLWRTTPDIGDDWASMLSIVERNAPLAPYAGPGHWNDPDMLEIGNGGMTETEYRSQFSLWAMMAAPLLISTDLAGASPQALAILGNREAIAIDQDPLGRQGRVLSDQGGRRIFAKPLGNGDVAVALFNATGQTATIATTAAAAGLPAGGRYALRDLWRHADTATSGEIAADVPPHGTVLYRVSPA